MSTLNSITPFFVVRSLQTAREFYVEQLGFECRFEAPDDEPFFAIVGRDSVSIMLKEIAPEVIPQPNATLHEWCRWDAFISVPDPDGLYDEFQDRAIEFVVSLSDTDDDLRGFEVKDADGYILFFGRPRG